MDSAADTQKPPAEHKIPYVKRMYLFSDTTVDVIGAAVTAATGLGAAVFSINANFFKNVHKYDIFFKERMERDDAWEVLKKKRVGNIISGQQLKEGVQKLEQDYTARTAATLTELELKQPWGKWGLLRTHQKTEAVISFAVGATVALGIVAGLISNRTVSKKQDELEQRLNTMDSGSPQR